MSTSIQGKGCRHSCQVQDFFNCFTEKNVPVLPMWWDAPDSGAFFCGAHAGLSDKLRCFKPKPKLKSDKNENHAR
jgi:hypothetical protein